MPGRAVCVVVAVGLAAAAPASAQVSSGAFRADPIKAGAAAHLIADLNFSDDPQSGGQSPAQMFFSAPAGLKDDVRAVSETCSPEQAASFDCPRDSRIATGFAEASLMDIAGVLPPQPLFADVEAFLGPPEQPGDVSSIVFQIQERSTGLRAITVARVVKLAPPYGLGMWIEHLDAATASAAPPGFRLRVDRQYGEMGTSRTVKKKAYKYVRRNGKKKRVGYYKTVRYDLLRNPRTCPSGGWPWSIRVVYANGAQSVREATMPCSR